MIGDKNSHAFMKRCRWQTSIECLNLPNIGWGLKTGKLEKLEKEIGKGVKGVILASLGVVNWQSPAILSLPVFNIFSVF